MVSLVAPVADSVRNPDAGKGAACWVGSVAKRREEAPARTSAEVGMVALPVPVIWKPPATAETASTSAVSVEPAGGTSLTKPVAGNGTWSVVGSWATGTRVVP